METLNNPIQQSQKSKWSKFVATVKFIIKDLLEFVGNVFRHIGNMFDTEAYGATIRSRWMYYFPDMKYSTKEFYEAARVAILSRGLPGVRVTTLVLPEGGWYSPQRLYLRISRSDYFFDICAAPYGNGFFISYWQGNFPNILARVLGVVPVVGKRLARWVTPRRTYFRVDTESMFLESVRKCVMEAIDAITAQQGCRAPNEMDRMPKDLHWQGTAH